MVTAGADTLRDTDGNEWTPFTNQYQQRMLRCVAGALQGDEIHDPRLGAPPSRPKYEPPRDPWLEGLYKSDFF